MHRRVAAIAAGLLALALGLWLVLEQRRAEASCASFADAEVWLILGQSNAANHAAVRTSAGPAVGAFDGRRCAAARDPLPGGSGDGGSLWPGLAELFVREGQARRVLLAVVAQESTEVADWQPAGRLHRRATRTARTLRDRGLAVTRILWLQGEADAIVGTPGAVYANRLAAALAPLHRAGGAPVWVATVGRCGNAFSPQVRAAQARIAAEREWIEPGPDLDDIGPEERHERCHYARSGQARAIRLWYAAIAGNGDLRNAR